MVGEREGKCENLSDIFKNDYKKINKYLQIHTGMTLSKQLPLCFNTWSNILTGASVCLTQRCARKAAILVTNKHLDNQEVNNVGILRKQSD